MLITKADLIRYLVVEQGQDGKLMEVMLKRRYPTIWAVLEAEGLEIDETKPENREFCTLIKKWKDYHDDLGDSPRRANKTG